MTGYHPLSINLSTSSARYVFFLPAFTMQSPSGPLPLLAQERNVCSFTFNKSAVSLVPIIVPGCGKVLDDSFVGNLISGVSSTGLACSDSKFSGGSQAGGCFSISV